MLAGAKEGIEEWVSVALTNPYGGVPMGCLRASIMTAFGHDLLGLFRNEDAEDHVTDW